MPIAIRSIKFWINAFIPRDIPFYTLTVPKGPYAGLTMIPGPANIRVPIPPRPSPYVIFQKMQVAHVGFSDCYLTDQRTFSNDIHAKSRMHSEVKIEFTGPFPVMTQWHNCDWTTECDCTEGEEECRKQGSTSRMNFSLVSRTPRVSIRMDCAACNPCAPSSRLVGDIDYNGNIIVDAAARSIQIDIAIDQFPAFEAYATINDGTGIPLFQEGPPPGNTVMKLPGKADRPVKCRLEDRDGDGVFEYSAI
jgi:hypothetical protein